MEEAALKVYKAVSVFYKKILKYKIYIYNT